MTVAVLCMVAAAALGLLATRLAAGAAAALRRQHQRLATEELADLFIFVSPRQLTLGCALAAVLGGAVALALGLAPLLVAALLVGCMVCPPWLLTLLRNRRQARVLAQLPDALGLLAGLLRAGHGLSQGLAQLAAHQPAPLGQELQLLGRKQRLGLPLESALEQFQQRVPGPDAALFVVAVSVSRDLGGNLSETLQRLSDGMRARQVLQGKIRALTSQGRLQGLIVGALPLLLLLVLGVMDPAPIRLLFTTTAGWCALALILLLESVGFALIRRIVRIDV